MHIHILGICGTFMGGIAILARQLGHTVSGSDQNVYPPMSTQLEQQGISLMSGYAAENLNPKPDLVIIGNALSRGNAEVEAVLNQGLHYTSGAQWLSDYILKDKWVLGVAGTHGKTTTTSMLTWVLEHQNLNPSFLIGGIPLNFSVSARLTDSRYFVIEADEYDTAFFDKRSKFVHYRPRTAILNNLEYDHADIFPDLAAIQKQFHHLVRTVPSEGLIIHPNHENNIQDVLKVGCWTPVEQTTINGESAWNANLHQADGSEFTVFYQGEAQGKVQWTLTGEHNVYNALSAIAAANHIGITPENAIAALNQFKNVKRRMEVIIKLDNLTVYDDFAHHPTAIHTTLAGLRNRVGSERIIAIIEPRSNTMRLGTHHETLATSLEHADLAIVYQPENLNWDLSQLSQQAENIVIEQQLENIINHLVHEAKNGGHFVIMSNGSFGGLYQKLKTTLNA